MGSLEQLPVELQALLEREKLEALAEFAAGAGHEMNNPLAVIAGRAQLLLQDETHPQRRRELAIIHTQALRVHEMIADLMLFARPPQPQFADIDLAQLCRRVLDEVAGQAQERRITLGSDIAEHAAAQADAVQIGVALRAVLDNAIEAVGHDGRIEVVCQPVSETTIAITVSDDGPGIPPEVRRHLFDPYFSGRQAGRGLGLGLSKCWRIVTNHGGRMEVECPDIRGAVLRLLLPVNPSAPAADS